MKVAYKAITRRYESRQARDILLVTQVAKYMYMQGVVGHAYFRRVFLGTTVADTSNPIPYTELRLIDPDWEMYVQGWCLLRAAESL
jgi:hypothetical protein